MVNKVNYFSEMRSVLKPAVLKLRAVFMQLSACETVETLSDAQYVHYALY